MMLTHCKWCGERVSDPDQRLNVRMNQYTDHVREHHPEKATSEADATDSTEPEAWYGPGMDQEGWPKEITFYAHGGKKTESHYDVADEFAEEGSDLYDELRYLANEIELTYHLHEDGRLELVRAHEQAGYGRDNREIDTRDHGNE